MWSKLFIRANIKEQQKLFIASITWSYYGIQHWQEIEIFLTIIEAEKWILKERTSGSLTYS